MAEIKLCKTAQEYCAANIAKSNAPLGRGGGGLVFDNEIAASAADATGCAIRRNFGSGPGVRDNRQSSLGKHKAQFQGN